MPYKESTRNYMKRVANGKCQYEWYTEEKGWQQCQDSIDQIHHIKGEAETLAKGKDPERNTPLPLCRRHHVKNVSASEHTHGFSFHPDIGEAYQEYPEWKRNEEHMMAIQGKKKIDYSTSPFASVAKAHQMKSKRGERYIAGTDEIDAYYEQKMTNKMVEYNATTGERKPKTKQHPNTDKTKQKHWWDFFFGTRSDPRDQES